MRSNGKLSDRINSRICDTERYLIIIIIRMVIVYVDSGNKNGWCFEFVQNLRLCVGLAFSLFMQLLFSARLFFARNFFACLLHFDMVFTKW